LRALLLRLLLSFPVGLVRVLLIDGVAQGHTLRRFGTILHADIRGECVCDNERDIAEELGKVRNRITQINHHVLSRSDSIQDHNRKNPEIPTPFQLVVVSEFPNGLNSQAQRTLQDIARNGPRAGVYILASMESSLAEMRDFDLNRLLAQSYKLKLDGNNLLAWDSEYFGSYRVQQDGFPPQAQTARTLELITDAYDKKPTILHYERVARDLPPAWTVPTVTGLEAPVGLTFGGSLHKIEFSDEFVHGLIGGRTGSGKTVFLHDLICGAIQSHAPEDLELYLLDFKGTEFNVYAKNQLPHARVVAVDCDVEIGLTVIDRLVQEMDKRRQLFDNANVPGIRHYRETGAKLPRVLLIIDEIQVLTQTADARMQRQVETALIDLLRRGRAAGIHVLLGTQSPSQVLSSPMLQQIAIRICLLADQQVSRLVLGESNEAASSLQKQGEAVYNAYNGAPDKNVFVRSALLDPDQIARIVRRLAQTAAEREFGPEAELIYFDGRRRSSLLDNPNMSNALAAPAEPAHSPSVSVPLGEPIEIKDETAVKFGREMYSNLVIVGGEGEQAHALVRNVLLGLCIVRPAEATQFYVIDLTYEDEPFSDAIQAFQAMPHEFQFARNSQVGVDLVEEVYEEFDERREQAKEGRSPDNAIFLVVYGMEDFADMRGEDRFSLPETRKRFDSILADGPRLGVHAIVATQTLGKGQILKSDSFGARVCFQVAEDDSRALLDNDAGTKLERRDRAILRLRNWRYGKVEKFKPYVPPSRDQIRDVANSLTRWMP